MFRPKLVWVSIGCMIVAGWAAVATAQWKPHTIRQINGGAAEIAHPAKLQIITESWNRVVACPYLAYMPEEDRLLMLVACDYPHRAMVMSSADRGATWSKPKALHLDAQGKPDAPMSVGLTYLGGGKLLANEGTKHWWSYDYGESWTSVANPPAANGNQWGEWDPLLVDRDAKTGKVLRLMSFCSDNHERNSVYPAGHFEGYVRFSTDEGRTWIGEIKVPQMYATNEVASVRARNGDIVAACRTDMLKKFNSPLDHYDGLAVSLSKDNGRTWSKLNVLYDMGRHHPCMVLMPNGEIVMTYVVRKGYPDTPDGLPQFGIEAVVSRDNGQSWDLDHRYILTKWTGNRKRVPDEYQPVPQAWWASSQATSAVLLPDGSLLTAFGTGYRSQPGPGGLPIPRDVGLVLWHPHRAIE
jgi:hypothetical protein